MTRHARLDTPGALHRGICRGIERQRFVRNDTDRAVCVEHGGRGLAATETPLTPMSGCSGRSPQIARARAGVAYLWCRVAGQSGRLLAAALGLSHQAVSAAAARGEREGSRWDAVWRKLP